MTEHPVPIDAAPRRSSEHAIDRFFLRRWSPRAMAADRVLAQEDLDRLFEAARWAPSSFNIQPWRFVYGLRPSPAFDRLLEVVDPANQIWAKDAGALLAMTSLTINPKTGKPAPTHSFDTGAAWMNLALQGSAMGLVVHGMAGFDRDRLAEVIRLPPEVAIEAMAAVGHPGEVEDLPEKLQEREKPSGREHIEAFAFEGRFPGQGRE